MAPATAIAVPTETPAAPVLDPTCLVGAWEAANLAQAMAESITVSGGSLTLEGVEGQAQYLFYPDGTMEIRYHQLAVVMNGMVDSREVRVVHSLDGSGSAQYAPDPLTGEILLSGFGGDGINTSLSINGQVLAEGSLPFWQAFLAGTGETDANAAPPDVQTARALATCEGDALTLQAVEPLPGQAVNLFRAP
jgi:hypothetical protein